MTTWHDETPEHEHDDWRDGECSRCPSTRRTVSTWPAILAALALVGLAYVVVVTLAGP